VTRIVAGAARGRRLAVPPAGTRPTSDRVREALFSALESSVGPFGGLRVADLYAGSGALGLEALSRGAAAVVLVEKSRRAADVARANAAAVGLPGARVVVDDVPRLMACAEPDTVGGPFGLVLLDPPYDVPDAAVEQVVADLAGRGWLDDGATVVVERSARGARFGWPEGYEPGRDRRYGETEVRTALWYRRDAASTH
jgi:16S rRNA (guanine966-N2)-methyltransferase